MLPQNCFRQTVKLNLQQREAEEEEEEEDRHHLEVAIHADFGSLGRQMLCPADRPLLSHIGVPFVHILVFNRPFISVSPAFRKVLNYPEMAAPQTTVQMELCSYWGLAI